MSKSDALPDLVEVSVAGFQSLEKITFTVGRFTAIVGPSNVGKSALVRALRMLAQNGSSTGMVRAGSKHLEVFARFADGTRTVIRRGPRLSEYELRIGGSGKVLEWAKCGTSAPDEIVNWWRLSDVTFAGQHDSPFMLAEAASTTATRLGELTNVSTVAEAVRIANRRRLAASQEQQARKRELDELVAELTLHKDLKARKVRLAYCRELLDVAASTDAQIQALAVLIGDAKATGIAMREAEAAVSSAEVPLAAVASATEAINAWESLADLVSERNMLELHIEVQEKEQAEQALDAEHCESQIKQLLADAGVCPVCNQEVH